MKVLVVEARDRVKGLQLGGDDYPVNPYAFDEPAARIAGFGYFVD